MKKIKILKILSIPALGSAFLLPSAHNMIITDYLPINSLAGGEYIDKTIDIADGSLGKHY